MEMKGRPFTIIVSQDSDGVRLDQFLSQTDLGLSRSQAKKRIEEGSIRLNQNAAKPSVHVKVQDRVSGTIPSTHAAFPLPSTPRSAPPPPRRLAADPC